MSRRIRKDDQGRVDIKSLRLDEIQQAMEEMGQAPYRALQVYKWLWQKGGVREFSEMTNLSKATREELASRYYISFLEKMEEHHSKDGTIKFVWRCHDNALIESVLIPEERRLTLCMSTQVGCAMACTFCLTGDLGLKRQLSSAEIVCQPQQVSRALGGTRISNLVLMGMGEPLHNLDNLVPALEIALDDRALNFSHRKITVSTVGLVPQMERLAEALPVNLAVSLNATTEGQRLEVMPITKRYSLETLVEACRQFPLPHAKRITFEYVMMAGFNDSMEDAVRLEKLLRGIRSKVNLIPYNENPNRDIRRPDQQRVEAFQTYLVSHGLQCSVRTTRGVDISAACGQLGKGAPGG